MCVHVCVCSDFILPVTVGLFSINSEGEIFTAVILDREAMSSYELNVETRDMGTPQMTCSVTVIVTVLDTNDNSPSIVNCLDVQFVNEVSMTFWST